jgi:Fic family protein
MLDRYADIKADIEGDMAVMDRGESVALMDPLLIAEGAKHRGRLTDLAVELAARSAGFRRSMPVEISAALADLVRALNCYYSNLIEGHDTHPIDIERALKNDYSADAEKRDLQVEAAAHIAVQQWIDGGGLKGRATTSEGLQETHARFIALLPESMGWATNPDTGERLPVVPGAWRTSDVRVGLHTAISPGAVPRFMAQFERAYSRLGRTDAILGAAAAHHRLVWIHPFIDGNGRVARLMSHASLLEALDTGGIWSVARGLARNVESYKAHLRQADLARRNDLDGRGNLSEEGLAEFATFFLETCLDQVSFMEALVQPDRLRTRILLWAEEETRLGGLPPKAGAILEAILYRGELPRGAVGELLGTTDRHGRRVTAPLLDRGVLVSDGPRDALRLAFSATLASRWMPGLFPDKPG